MIIKGKTMTSQDLMTVEKFENYLDQYGADVATWPLVIRDQGQAFLLTDEGVDLAQKSNNAAAQLLNLKAETAHVSTPTSLLDRLYDIAELPQQITQQISVASLVSAPKTIAEKINGFMQDLADTFTLKVAFTQATAMVSALVLGVYLSADPQMMPTDTETEDYDISASMFAELEDTSLLSDSFMEEEE